jgi:general secretion pathway protein N
MIRPPKRIGPLLTLSAALAGVVALELAAGPFFVPDAPQDRRSADNLADSPTDLPAENQPQSAFSEIVARPLFSPSRRPPSAQPESKVVANDTKSETFDLIGVIISADSRMALLRTQDTSEVVRAIEGQSVGGWEVRTINPTQVVLERGSDSEVLKISNIAENPATSNPGAPSVNPGTPGVNTGEPGDNPGAPATTGETGQASVSTQKTPAAETPTGE